jgi:hypothetical protein
MKNGEKKCNRKTNEGKKDFREEGEASFFSRKGTEFSTFSTFLTSMLQVHPVECFLLTQVK